MTASCAYRWIRARPRWRPRSPRLPANRALPCAQPFALSTSAHARVRCASAVAAYFWRRQTDLCLRRQVAGTITDTFALKDVAFVLAPPVRISSTAHALVAFAAFAAFTILKWLAWTGEYVVEPSGARAQFRSAPCVVIKYARSFRRMMTTHKETTPLSGFFSRSCSSSRYWHSSRARARVRRGRKSCTFLRTRPRRRCGARAP